MRTVCTFADSKATVFFVEKGALVRIFLISCACCRLPGTLSKERIQEIYGLSVFGATPPPARTSV